MNARLLSLLALVSLAASPVFAADRLADTSWSHDDAPPAAPNAWHFSLAAALGGGPESMFDGVGTAGAASLELAVGHDLSARWSLEGVLSAMMGVEGGFVGLGVRPLYVLNEHFDLGAIVTVPIGLPNSFGHALAVGPHLGLRNGALYAFFEPMVVFSQSSQSPFDNDTEQSSGVSLLPLRFGVGVRF